MTAQSARAHASVVNRYVSGVLEKILVGVVALALVEAPAVAHAQASPSRAPDECFGFSFGRWDPPLSSASSTYSPGYDPTSSAPAGAPRAWALRSPTGSRNQTQPADSVLLLFPVWWPAGVAIQWTEQRGDTLVGIARALIADGRVKNPETGVKAKHVLCRSSDSHRLPPKDTAVTRGS